MTSSSAMLVSLSSVASQLDTAGVRSQQLVTAGAADHNNQQLVSAGAADNQLDTQQTATWLQLAAWALATLQQSVHGFYGAVRSPAAVLLQIIPSCVVCRDDRIYSDSIRIRIFFLESRIFGFENFGDRIIFEYSNLFP